MDEISACNQALAEIGGGILGSPRIMSFDDGTSLGTLAGELYPDTRDMVIELHPWNWATAFAALGRSPDPPVMKWTYSYLLPTLPWCIKVRGTDQGNGARFEVGTDANGHRVLFSDEGRVSIEYSKRVEDLGSWSPLALQVLVKLLASKFAKPLSGQNSTAQLKMEEALALLPEAKGSDGKEGSPFVLRPNRTLIYARQMSGGRGWR